VILFCDTSALMKAYAKEEHSEQVRNLLQEAASCFVSLITWAEMCAAFGLKERTQKITGKEVSAGLQRLKKEWGSFGQIAVDEDLMIEAGELALRFGLRAYDSVQLASAQRVHRQLGRKLVFCCFDKQLNAAAAALAINILPH
jgi:predicted nucleic acid-binding protein